MGAKFLPYALLTADAPLSSVFEFFATFAGRGCVAALALALVVLHGSTKHPPLRRSAAPASPEVTDAAIAAWASFSPQPEALAIPTPVEQERESVYQDEIRQGDRRVHRHQPGTPSEPRGIAFPSAHGEAPAGAGIWMTLRTPPGVGDGAVSVTGRTAVPAAA